MFLLLLPAKCQKMSGQLSFICSLAGESGGLVRNLDPLFNIWIPGSIKSLLLVGIVISQVYSPLEHL